MSSKPKRKWPPANENPHGNCLTRPKASCGSHVPIAARPGCVLPGVPMIAVAVDVEEPNATDPKVTRKALSLIATAPGHPETPENALDRMAVDGHDPMLTIIVSAPAGVMTVLDSAKATAECGRTVTPLVGAAPGSGLTTSKRPCAICAKPAYTRSRTESKPVWREVVGHTLRMAPTMTAPRAAGSTERCDISDMKSIN